VARSLLGTRLVRDDAGGRIEGRIVEVEAYDGPDDRASHARFGRTDRNRVMFGPAGIAYVYLVYGMYDCLNVVCGPDGRPSAVLIRAVEPLVGLERMLAGRLAVTGRRRVGRTADALATTRARLAALAAHRLASGPGLVAAAFGIDTGWSGTDLCDPAGPLRLERRDADRSETAGTPIVATARIGVGYAGPDWAGRPWRFALAAHPSLSGPASAR
jgi:DNA-3-methyladenine glycosylase